MTSTLRIGKKFLWGAIVGEVLFALLLCQKEVPKLYLFLFKNGYPTLWERRIFIALAISIIGAIVSVLAFVYAKNNRTRKHVVMLRVFISIAALITGAAAVVPFMAWMPLGRSPDLFLLKICGVENALLLRLSPIYLFLGFGASPVAHTMMQVTIYAAIGNGLLYGLLAVVLYLATRFITRLWAPPHCWPK